MLRNLRFPFIIFAVVMTKIDSYGFFSCVCYWKSFQCQRNLCSIYRGTYIQSFTPKENEGLAFKYCSEIITQLLSPRLNHLSFTSLNLGLSKLSFSHMKAVAISCYHNSVIRFSFVTFRSKTKISKIKTMKLSPN